MDSLCEVRFDDFRAALTVAELRAMQLFQVGVGGNLVLLGLLAAFLQLWRSPEGGGRPPNAELVVQVLTAVHVAGAMVAVFLSRKLCGWRFSAERLAAAVRKPLRDSRRRPINEPAAKCVAIIRSATILRLVVLDTGVSLGLVTCIVAAWFGVLGEHLGYWLNALSGAWLLGYVVATFPTRERVEGIFVEKIAGQRWGA